MTDLHRLEIRIRLLQKAYNAQLAYLEKLRAEIEAHKIENSRLNALLEEKRAVIRDLTRKIAEQAHG